MHKFTPCLFLSHSGSDTESARKLKRRILDSPTARDAGLTVWFDKDDLKAGRDWQTQLEDVIENKATAFAVYVGAHGVVNWVLREVRVGLSRAAGKEAIPFIPIIASEAAGATALPSFVRQFQAVKDPLKNEDELQRLIDAALDGVSDKEAILTDSPFVGLRPMTEQEADRFFGRSQEIVEVIEKLRRKRLVAIISESGSGKSSLASAGVIPAYRGGALEDTTREEPDGRTRHVVVMRPGNNPAKQLRKAITHASERLNLSGEVTASLRKRVDLTDPEETAYAIRCDLPVRSTETLLIVDQFEEFLRLPLGQSEAFVRLLLNLTAEDAPNGFRVLLTVRSDYFNLCRPYIDLCKALTRDNNEAIYRLKRISDQGLYEAVRKPLAMAGHQDEQAQKALHELFRRDIMERPGDLALVQMALFSLWRHRNDYNGNLVNAYIGVGGISGALAHEAERVRVKKLTRQEQECLLATFVRLIRLGDTGGVTRRIARLDEFDTTRRALAEKLAADEYSRLLMAGEETIEVAHEALITQWPWLHENIGHRSTTNDIRRLERLMDRADARASASTIDKSKYWATGADLDEFSGLHARHSDWLSAIEAHLVEESMEVAEKDRYEKDHANKRTQRYFAAAAGTFAILAAILLYFWVESGTARKAADAAKAAVVRERNEARITQSRFLSDLAQQQARNGDGVSAQLLALAGLKDASHDTEKARNRPFVHEAERGLYEGRFVNRELAILKGHKRLVRSVSFSPSGDRIASASDDRTARIWDARSGEEIRLLKGHGGSIWSTVFSPSGDRIATASDDSTARIWDVNTGNTVAILEGHQDSVVSAVFDPSGDRIATASRDNTARIWDAKTGTQIALLKGHTDWVESAVFSPSGDQIAKASTDGTARIWDAKKGTEVTMLKGHSDWVESVIFNPSGHLIATASEDGTARVWDTKSGGLISILRGHKGSVGSAVFNPSGDIIATASADKTARIWDANSGRQITVLTGHTDGVRSVIFNPSGNQVATVSYDRTVRVWDAKPGKQIAVLNGHKDFVWSAAFGPHGDRIATASSDKTVRIWGAKSGNQIAILNAHEGSVQHTAFSPNGKRIATGSSDRKAKIWDAKSGEQVTVLEGHDDWVHSVAFSPSGKRVVTSSSDKIALIWEIESGNPLTAFKGHQGSVWSAVFNPSGTHVATASSDRTARVWDVKTGKEIAELEGHMGTVWSALFNPSGDQIATASSDNTVRIWNIKTEELVSTLIGHKGIVWSAVFSPTGDRIATASSDKTARIWDVSSGKQLAILNGHDDWVQSVVFSPSGTRVATASHDMTARIWDARTGRQFAILKGHGGAVISVAFSPSGDRIATAAHDGTARIWNVLPTTQALIDNTKLTVLRCLTKKQLEQFYLPEQPPRWCITGSGLEQEKDPGKWQPKWPYHGTEWREWLIARDRGEDPPQPDED